MDFYNKALECSDIIKNINNYILKFNEEIKSNWEGKVFEKFISKQEECISLINTINMQCNLFICIGNNIKELEELDNQLIDYKNKLESTEVVDSIKECIDALKVKKNVFISRIIEYLNDIIDSNFNISLILNNNDLYSSVFNYNFGSKDTLIKSINVKSEKNNTIGSNDKNNANIKIDNKLEKESTSNKSINLVDGKINLGEGQYMTEADWNNSPYVSKEDFRCQCGGKYCSGYPVEISKTLVEDLNNIRLHYNKPIIITSGIRCNQHNKNIGGATNSRHTRGKAVDFYIEGVSSNEINNYVKTIPTENYSYTGSQSGYNMDGVVHYDVL